MGKKRSVAKRLDDSGTPGGDRKELTVLVGYFGPSTKAGHVRLYTGPDTQSYHEIPAAPVQRTKRTVADDPNSPTRVYVTGSDAPLFRVALAILAPDTKATASDGMAGDDL
jgi:hypothetical protein